MLFHHVDSYCPMSSHSEVDACFFGFTSHGLYLDQMILHSMIFSNSIFNFFSSFTLHLFLASPLLGHPFSLAIPSWGSRGRKLTCWGPIVYRTAVKDMKKSHLTTETDCCFPHLPPGQQLMIVCGARAWQCLIGWLFLRPCVGACKCGIVGSAIVCSSFRQELIPTWKRCWAGVQEQRQGGAPGSWGDPIPKQRSLVRDCGCLFVCSAGNTENMGSPKSRQSST